MIHAKGMYIYVPATNLLIIVANLLSNEIFLIMVCLLIKAKDLEQYLLAVNILIIFN